MKSGASDPFADDTAVDETADEETTDEQDTDEEAAADSASDNSATDDQTTDTQTNTATSKAGAETTSGSKAGAETTSGSKAESGPTETANSDSEEVSSSDNPVSNTGQFNRSELPYIFRRDKVKDERDSVHQLFVQSGTDETERGARRDLKDRFDESVYKLDAREAIYLAGMQNLDDAEALLREWGYDL